MPALSATQHLAAPIFIVGAARSGTTLASKILSRHPEIAAPGESHFFEDIWTRGNEFGALQTEPEVRAAVDRLKSLYGRYNFPETQRIVDQFLDETVFVQQVLAAGGGYAQLYHCFMTMLAEVAGKQRYCDDTPKHLFHLADILLLFPAAKIIGCVRDPRDFLCSYKNYWQRSTESDRMRALYHPIITSSLWRSSARQLAAGIAQNGDERLALLKYETLVSNPEQDVQRLCRFLEISYTPDMLRVKSSNSSFEETTREGIFTVSVARWRSCLEPEEVKWAQALTRAQMSHFGYQAEKTDASWGKTILILLQTPGALIRALRANRDKRGPLGQYLLRRLTAIVGR